MQEVIYKCVCMAAERSVYVQTRQPGQDLQTWMGFLVHTAIAEDHHIISPHCQRVNTEYAKIPLKENSPGIGMASPPHG